MSHKSSRLAACRYGVCKISLTPTVIDRFIDDLVAVANRHSVFYLLRPHLKDADDDFILELAFSSGVDYIVTHNTPACRVRDADRDNFRRAKMFGIDAITPKMFLQKIGEIQ